MRATKIASMLGGRLLGDDQELLGIASLTTATAFDLSFIIWPKDILWAKKTHSRCLIAEIGIVAEYANELSASMIAIDNLYDGFLLLDALIKSGDWLLNQNPIAVAKNIAPSATIHPSAVIGKSHIGDGTIIAANVVVKDGAIIGQDCEIDAGAVLHSHVTIKDGTKIGANSVIGAPGFVPYGLGPTKCLPLLGSVMIGPNVRIGALCTVDRGLISTTYIGSHALLDNMVHVGHDAFVGENVVMAGQSGIAGFARINSHVTCGGQVGIAPHVTIDEGARVSGKTFVHCDIKKHEIWSGNPALPHAIYLRSYSQLKRNFRATVR